MNGLRMDFLISVTGATSSLPVPDSPVISTVAGPLATRPIVLNTSFIARLRPTMLSEPLSA